MSLTLELVASELDIAVAALAAIPRRPDLVSRSMILHTLSTLLTGIKRSHLPEFIDQVPVGEAESIQ